MHAVSVPGQILAEQTCKKVRVKCWSGMKKWRGEEQGREGRREEWGGRGRRTEGEKRRIEKEIGRERRRGKEMR
jgi:hypothetical protein